ncbi:MAG TPA: T9SS type A sorting domain-containing protein [Candidatus Kapabacteria bacterium]
MKKIVLISILLLAGRTACGQASHVPNYTPGGFTCSSGFDMSKKKQGQDQIQEINSDTTGQYACGHRWSQGIALENDASFEAAYDTLRLFMEICPQYPDSWDGFSDVGGAVSGWSAGGDGRWSDYLYWLKQVLYFNLDTLWYCADVEEMLSALQDNQVAKQAAMKYVLESGKCPIWTSAFQESYNAASHWRHTRWLDSIIVKYDTMTPLGEYQWWVDSLVNQDTLAHPYDSTIPPLSQFDLQLLMGPQNADGVPPSRITSQALLSAQLMENPTETNEIGVSYQMGRTALVTMQLYDLLGKAVPITNAKYQLQQPGTHEATIPVPNLPPGTYYLRLSTDAGDAITLKVIKQ